MDFHISEKALAIIVGALLPLLWALLKRRKDPPDRGDRPQIEARAERSSKQRRKELPSGDRKMLPPGD